MVGQPSGRSTRTSSLRACTAAGVLLVPYRPLANYQRRKDEPHVAIEGLGLLLNGGCNTNLPLGRLERVAALEALVLHAAHPSAAVQ